MLRSKIIYSLRTSPKLNGNHLTTETYPNSHRPINSTAHLTHSKTPTWKSTGKQVTLHLRQLELQVTKCIIKNAERLECPETFSSVWVILHCHFEPEALECSKEPQVPKTCLRFLELRHTPCFY